MRDADGTYPAYDLDAQENSHARQVADLQAEVERLRAQVSIANAVLHQEYAEVARLNKALADAEARNERLRAALNHALELLNNKPAQYLPCNVVHARDVIRTALDLLEVT